jgi:hypothetical protein
MKSMFARKTLIIASVLSLVAIVSQAKSPAEDTSAGTWKLNVVKSTFASNTPPKSEIRTHTVTPQGTRVVIEDEYADGKKTRVETLVTYDGKPRPSTGSGIWDSTATKRIDRNVAEAELIRDGKVVGNVRREVSPDGNTMKMVYVINRPDGTTVSTLSVFERQ